MKYTRVDKRGNVLPQIERTVVIQHIFDCDSTPEDYLFQDPDYQAEDQKRLDDWKADKWHFIGIRVEVRVHNWLTGHTHQFTSSGLWSIESDSDNSYLAQVAEEQLAELQAEFPQLKDLTTVNATIEYCGG